MGKNGEKGPADGQQREKTGEVGISATVQELLNKNHIIFLCLRSYSFQNNYENREKAQVIIQ